MPIQKPYSEFKLSHNETASIRKQTFRHLSQIQPGNSMLFEVNNPDDNRLIKWLEVYTVQFNKENKTKLKTRFTDDGILVFNP